jgi:hypothetical protein
MIQERSRQPLSCDFAEKEAAVDMFSMKVNDAINEKWTTLQEFEAEVISLEESFNDEEQFIESFGSGDTNHVVTLNVSGTIMATSRATLLLFEESVLPRITRMPLTMTIEEKKWKPSCLLSYATFSFDHKGARESTPPGVCKSSNTRQTILLTSAH